MDDSSVDYSSGRERDDSGSTEGLTKDDFITAYGHNSTDYADAVIAGRGDDYVPSVGFHVTRDSNVEGIEDGGLDPNRGGRGGASEALGEEQFLQNSQGQVHYATDLATSEFYTDFLENKSGEDTTLLGVIADPDSGERDPDDDRQAWRTSAAIGPEQIVDLSDVRNSPFYNDPAMQIPTYEELHPAEETEESDTEEER